MRDARSTLYEGWTQPAGSIRHEGSTLDEGWTVDECSTPPPLGRPRDDPPPGG
jgi:hypothetical protein